MGVPARLAGTPAWNGSAENGNHSWIEVYVNNEWRFTEFFPAANGVTSIADDSYDPCNFWFCNSFKFDGQTRVYATRLDASADDTFPLAWDVNDTGVPGVNRTDFMTLTCSVCA